MFKKILQSLSARIVLIVSFGIIVTVTAGLVIESQTIKKQVLHSLHEEMRMVFNSAQSTTESIGDLAQAGAFNYQELSRELAEKGPENFRDTLLYKTIPVVAAWEAIRQSIKGTPIEFRIVRAKPRNLENTPRTDLERQALAEVSKSGVKDFFIEDDSAGLIAYA